MVKMSQILFDKNCSNNYIFQQRNIIKPTMETHMYTQNSSLRRCFRDYAIPKSRSSIFVRSCGHYQCSAPFRDRVKKKQFLELFWIIRGICTFVVDDRVVNIGSNWTFFYLPGDTHQVEVRSGNAEYAWLTIFGSKMAALIDFLGITRGEHYSGNCPIKSFSRLETYLRENSEEGEKESGKLAFSILSDAVCGTSKGNFLTDTFKMLVQENIADPRLNVGSLAATLGVHRSTLHRIFIRETGISPLAWITQYRMEYATELLTDSNLRIKEIADRCGIADQNYFSKLVRRYRGNSPTGFRRSEASSSRGDHPSPAVARKIQSPPKSKKTI